MNYVKPLMLAAMLALGGAAFIVPDVAQAGASTGTWANGAVTAPNGRVYRPDQGYRNGYGSRQHYRSARRHHGYGNRNQEYGNRNYQYGNRYGQYPQERRY